MGPCEQSPLWIDQVNNLTPIIKWPIQAVSPACNVLKSDWLKNITFNQVNFLPPPPPPPPLNWFRGEIVHLVQIMCDWFIFNIWLYLKSMCLFISKFSIVFKCIVIIN